MSRILYDYQVGSFADGATVGTYVPLTVDERVSVASSHQLTIVPAESATGVVKIILVAAGLEISGANLQYIKDGLGADIEIDLADGTQTVVFEVAAAAVGAIVTTEIAEGCDVYVSGW
jgi:hypothetical protein